MKVLSLYCGAGGIDEGLRQAGIKTTLAIDIWKDACQTMKLNHPDTEVICSKVSDVKDSLGDFDMVVGGPPCPEFSRANIGRTLDPCEVNNFWSVVNLTNAKYWIMENVPDVNKVIKNRKNYLVNCADYGVPQIRLRRIFTNLPLPKETHTNYVTEDLFGNKLKPWVSVRAALKLNGYLLDCKYKHYERKSGFNSTSKPSKTIDTQSRELFIEDRKTTFGEREFRKYSIDRPSHTLVKDAREFYNGRPLSNKELSILQGFPNNYHFFGTKQSVKEQIGNAVPPPLIKAFAEQIMPEIHTTKLSDGEGKI